MLFGLLTTAPSSCHLPPLPSHISTDVSLLHSLFCKGAQETEKRQQAARFDLNQDTRMTSGQQFQIWACHYKLPAKFPDIEDNPAGNLAHQLCGNVLPMPTQPLRGRAKACCHPGDKEPGQTSLETSESPKPSVGSRAATVGWNDLSRSQNCTVEWFGSEGP